MTTSPSLIGELKVDKLYYVIFGEGESIGVLIYVYHFGYAFKELASNTRIVNGLQHFPLGIELRREVPVKDLPLFMYLPYRSNLFDLYMKGAIK